MDSVIRQWPRHARQERERERERQLSQFSPLPTAAPLRDVGRFDVFLSVYPNWRARAGATPSPSLPSSSVSF